MRGRTTKVVTRLRRFQAQRFPLGRLAAEGENLRRLGVRGRRRPGGGEDLMEAAARGAASPESRRLH